MTTDWFPDVAEILKPDVVEGETIHERFISFHALNPWVLFALEKLAADYLASGRTRLSIGMLTEVLRWHYGRATIGDEFKLNNNFRSRYVRLMIGRHPEWASAFTLRELTAL